MKCNIKFEELKKAVQAAGKAIKKSPLEQALIKLEAKGEVLELSVSGLLGAVIQIPAAVKEEGEFVTSYASINIISVRKDTGTVTMANVDDNTLVLKYKKAKTVLAKNNTAFADVAQAAENIPSVSIPIADMRKIAKETIFVSDDDPNTNLHALKMDIQDDMEGLIKLTVSACDGKSMAVRTVYAVKDGNYTGSTILLPEQMKAAMDIMQGDEGNIKISIGDSKIFMQYENVRICFPEISKQFPNLSSILKQKNCSFSAKFKKQDLIDALNCAIYLENNQPVATGRASSVELTFEDDGISISCTGLSEYTEKIDAELTGEIDDSALFTSSLLKEIVNMYPSDTVILGGTKSKNPFWMCAGEHDEYIYCIMPKVKVIPKK